LPYVTLSFPPGTPVVAPAGQWEQDAAGNTIVTYRTRAELCLCIRAMDEVTGHTKLCDGGERIPPELYRHRHRSFWKRPEGGWVCAICYPPPPGVVVTELPGK